MSDQLKVMPETVISFGVPIDSAKRKEMAIEYWRNFLAWFNMAYPQMQKTNTINAYRSFLAAHNIRLRPIEIARILGITLSNASVQIHRLKKKSAKPKKK
jgi:hypothetical protein